MQNNEFSQTQTTNPSDESTVAEAKRMGQNLAQEAKHVGENLAQEAKQVVSETVDEAKGQVKSTLNDQKSRAVQGLDNVAGALRRTGQDLASGENQSFAQYADAAADQVERLSGYLKNREVSDLVEDLRSVAHRQPELFVAGALAAGFLVGRFLKSSGTQARQGAYQGRNYEYSGYGQSYEQPYGQASSGMQSSSQYSGQEGSSTYSSNPYGTSWSQGNPSTVQNIPIEKGENYGR